MTKARGDAFIKVTSEKQLLTRDNKGNDEKISSNGFTKRSGVSASF